MKIPLYMIALLLVSYYPTAMASKTIDCKKEVPQEGRNEPQYIGMSGYTSVSGFYSFQNYDKKLPKYPFQISLLKQSGPDLWEESLQKIPAKLPIKVIKQVLQHEGYGRHKGHLLVQVVGTKKKFMIDPSNFSPVAYWKCGSFNAVKYSPDHWES